MIEMNCSDDQKLDLSQQGVANAEKLIRKHIRRTPVLSISGCELGLGDFELNIKLEFLQHAGNFKTRGAFTSLLCQHVPPVGVVAASGGNHGASTAYAAQKLGISARIFVPIVCSTSKIDRLKEFGADLVIGGERYDNALEASRTYAAETGALQIHAFDQV